jgi:hypothetical protein
MNTVLRLKELLLAEYDYKAQIEQTQRREPANPRQEQRYQQLYKLLILLEDE